jgi:diguanylate cyclase (GGDEF)-like protein
VHNESLQLPLRLLLSFSELQAEQRFLQQYSQFYRRYAQASLLLGMLLIFGDWMLDHLAFAQVTANALRLALSLPILALGLLLSVTRLGKAHWQALMVAVIVSVGFSLYWTLLLIDLQGGSGLGSWVGVLNFTFFELYCFVILGIGFRYALMAGLALFAGFEAFIYAHLASQTVSFAYLSYHTFTAFLLAATIGWWREYLLRQAFQASTALEEATRVARSQAEFLQHHDATTGLLNLAGFTAQFASEMAAAKPEDRPVPLLLIDMERLHRAGNTLGQKVSDALLLTLVDRLRGVVADMQPAPELARTASFELAVLIRHAVDTGAIIDAAGRILEALTKPLDMAGQTFHLQPSGGLALYPQDGESPNAVFKAARVALTLDGRESRPLHFYDPERNHALSQRLKLEDDLRQALGNGQLTLAYQPLVRMADQQAVGVETLLRWTHPEHGSVSPVQFVPILEDIGLMPEVGEWVLAQACQQAAQWLAAGRVLHEVAVNVSGMQLAAPDFVGKVSKVLEASGLPPRCLVLELTESVLVHDNEYAIAQLHALKRLGLRLALDDFGTGFSSLASVARLPFDIIKLDRSFVLAAPTQPTAAAILEGIIALSRRLNLVTVAEGIEDTAQLALLSGMGCDLAQGFLFARPGNADQAQAYLQPGSA